MLKIFKIKTPDRETLELSKLYDFLFDNLVCGWAGRTGHYAYSEDPTQIAENQDGYIYCWEHTDYSRKISASPEAYRYKYPIDPLEVPELILPK
ncbi:hypothetical protein DJ533_00140 (plasmid) [Acinetobacter defluvii]|uniref:Uncharacterized protein n=1 Tax=Acinetobacter defluvii TaxID=1871111 RepID=A0A2S2F896_9GAMM|nr:hypothetical protein [Acinetobacter defluvii]AWL27128.1 hypothetical protein DJ533_00140 [Acinetobacter defluvii]